MIASKRTHAEEPLSNSASTVMKKQKKNVTFDIKNEPNELVTSSSNTESNKKSSQFANIHYRYIQNAIEEVDKNNDTTQIESLIKQIEQEDNHKDKIKPENFEILLTALSNNITKVENNPKFNSLVISIINYKKWHKISLSSCVFEYMTFLKILCSSLPKWLAEVASVLISQLVDVPLKESEKRHHSLIQYFVKVFPTSVNLFTSNLSKNFPNKNDTKQRNVNYVDNLLKITNYCPEFKFPIWSLVVEKAISIDVELQNELDDLDDDIESLDSDAEDEVDDDDEDDNSDGESSDGESSEGESSDDVEDDVDDDEVEDEEETKRLEAEEESYLEGEEEYQVELSSNIKELSNKLDSMLSIVSDKLAVSLSSRELEDGDGVNVFNTLMALFKSHILPTYYTKSIQYLMFHAAQQQPELMDAFLVTLIDISFSPNESMENKIKALQYVGSFIARAKKLTKTQILFVSSYLTSWLNRYVMEREVEVDVSPGGMERFKHFYAGFQALCYIFCFRHEYFKVDYEEPTKKNNTSNNKSTSKSNEREITDSIDINSKQRGGHDESTGSWECDIDKFFQRMVISKFNPLKFCNENVMLMFAKITQRENLVYCYSIIEKNTNDRLRGIMSGGGSSSLGGSSNGAKSASNPSGSKGFSLVARQQFIDLQSYFPYDPLFLKKYKKVMQEFYIEWSEVSGDYETDDSEESDEAGDDEDQD